MRALNKLLQPVRDHFTNDDTACELLEQVREFKRETTASAAAVVSGETPKVFRLDLVKAGVVPMASHLVMAPLPEANPTLQCVTGVLAILKGGSDVDMRTPRVLMLLGPHVLMAVWMPIRIICMVGV